MAAGQLNLFGIKIDREKKLQKDGVVIPVDTTVLLAVVIILLLTLSFSWGVEKGRRLTLQDLSAEKEMPGQATVTAIKEPTTDKSPQREQAEEEETEIKTTARATETEIEEATKTKKIETEQVLYKIQVASFLTINSAKQEASRLKEKGFPVIIDQKGRYSVVYVGNFQNENEAKATQEKLKTTYNDSILRRLN